MNLLKSTTSVFVGSLCLFGTGVASAETLGEAVTEVLQTHPQVRAQAYNRLAKDQEVGQAKAGYFPTLDIEGAIGWADYQEPDVGNLDPREASISVRQNVFNGMATINEVSRTEAGAKSSAYALQGVSENMALRTAAAYLEVLRRQEIVSLAQENLLNHQRIADQVELRSNSGVGSQADADQVQGRLSLAQSNVVVTETNLMDAKTNYLALVGHLPGDLNKPVSPEGWMPPSIDEAEKIALDEHPTLKSANADLEARKFQDDVADSPFYPILDLELDQIWQEDMTSDETREEKTIAMVRLRYNLFNGFNDRSRQLQTTQLVSEAREIRNNTARQVVESLRLSWMAYQAVVQREEYVKKHVDASQATTESYSKQFDLGKRTLLDVLDTEAELIEAKRDLIDVMYDGLYAQYRILNSMGRLTETLGLSLPEESVVEE
jgi:adhesin transport system outer membrane protein